MFDGLLDPSLGIYAVTAANPKESSWGWYCDKATKGGDIQGKWLGVCLGDEFSVRWMEDTDAADEEHETLAEQYSAVQAAVNKSHVMKYGNFSFGASPLSAFLGSEEETSRTVRAPWPSRSSPKLPASRRAMRSCATSASASKN